MDNEERVRVSGREWERRRERWREKERERERMREISTKKRKSILIHLTIIYRKRNHSLSFFNPEQKRCPQGNGKNPILEGR